MTPVDTTDQRAALPVAATGPQRLTSLDAFRGAVMLLMASSGFGLVQVAHSHPDSAVWRFIGNQVEHAPWAGFTLWDFIQPAFMFMVGVALPWSIANRRAKGQGFTRMLVHALWRSLALVLLAVFLTSAWSRQTQWVFTNVLGQIGLGYPFLFLLAFTRPRTQALAGLAILASYWLLFALFPLAPSEFDWKAVGLSDGWPRLTGFAAHWEKNVNAAAAFDQWFLNLFPREKTFVCNSGGYQTLNFVPSLVTMICGLLCGQWLRANVSLSRKLAGLFLCGLAITLLGLAVSAAGWCPIVKRIWTPSWVLFSSGIVTLLLGLFVAIIDSRGWTKWAFPLVVAGLNPIVLYCFWQLSSNFVRDSLKTHLGTRVFALAGPAYATLVERTAILLVLWLILLWLWRRKIFLRI